MTTLTSTCKLINILKRDDRSQEDIQFLKAYLSNNKFFCSVFESFKASPNVINDLCRAVKYETYPRYSLIFKQDSKNCDKVYVILKGKAMVFMRSIVDVVPQEGEEIEEIAPVLSHSKSYIEEFLETNKQDDNNEERNCISDNDFMTVLGMEYGNMILEIEEGALVGEKALIENKPRAATICTRSPCELLILVKKDFELIKHRYNKQQFKKKEFIISRFPFLVKLANSVRIFERVVRLFEEETFERNHVVVKEGQILKSYDKQKVFLIVSGEVDIFKNETNTKDSLHLLNSTKKKPIQVATLGQNEFFGEELISQYGKDEVAYYFTATCVSSVCQFLTLNTQALVKQLPEEIKLYMEENFAKKKKFRNNFFKGYQKQIKEIYEVNRMNSNDKFDVEKGVLKKISKNLEEVGNVEEIRETTSRNDKKIKLQFDEGRQLPQYQKKQFSATQGKVNEFRLNSPEKKEGFYQQQTQSIKGSSREQNAFLLNQLRTDISFKLKNEGDVQIDRYSNEDNSMLSFKSERSHQYDKNNQEPKKVQAFPFTVLSKHRYFKQLKDQLLQKHFEFADPMEVFHRHCEQNTDNSKKDTSIQKQPHQYEVIRINSQSPTIKRTPIQLNLKVINQIAHTPRTVATAPTTIKSRPQRDTGYQANSLKMLGEIKNPMLHNILTRVADKYAPHEEFFSKDFDSTECLQQSRNNARVLFKNYQQSEQCKNLVAQRKILSRSPLQRRSNAIKDILEQGGGAISIPSCSRYIVDNHHNINSNYYFYKTSIPKSEAHILNPPSQSKIAVVPISESVCQQFMQNRNEIAGEEEEMPLQNIVINQPRIQTFSNLQESQQQQEEKVNSESSSNNPISISQDQKKSIIAIPDQSQKVEESNQFVDGRKKQNELIIQENQRQVTQILSLKSNQKIQNYETQHKDTHNTNQSEQQSRNDKDNIEIVDQNTKQPETNLDPQKTRLIETNCISKSTQRDQLSISISIKPQGLLSSSKEYHRKSTNVDLLALEKKQNLDEELMFNVPKIESSGIIPKVSSNRDALEILDEQIQNYRKQSKDNQREEGQSMSSLKLIKNSSEIFGEKISSKKYI